MQSKYNMDEINADTIISDILIEYPELTDYLMEKQLCRADSGPYSVMSLKLSDAAKLFFHQVVSEFRVFN